jgi:hypothetical protein
MNQLSILQISGIAITIIYFFYIIHAIYKNETEKAISFGLAFLVILILVLYFEYFGGFILFN